MKAIMSSVAAAALLSVGALALSVSPASARIVCNAAGDCWHTDHYYHYGFRPEYHPDDWYFHRHWDGDARYHWREYHEGRGYYNSGVWTPF